jgi:hypothetical protein
MRLALLDDRERTSEGCIRRCSRNCFSGTRSATLSPGTLTSLCGSRKAFARFHAHGSAARCVADGYLCSPDLPGTSRNATASIGVGEPCLSIDRVLFQPSGSRITTVERRERSQFTIRAVAVASDPEALHGFLLAGEGLLLTNHVRVKSDVAAGRLVRVLPEWAGPEPTSMRSGRRPCSASQGQGIPGLSNSAAGFEENR